ncbi:MAG: hypothetical protein AAB897_00465 [Patescibacteria group bacterium]
MSSWDFFERDLLSTLADWEMMTERHKTILKSLCESASETAAQSNRPFSIAITAEGIVPTADAPEHGVRQPNELLRLTFRPNGEIVADFDQRFRNPRPFRAR